MPVLHRRRPWPVAGALFLAFVAAPAAAAEDGDGGWQYKIGSLALTFNLDAGLGAFHVANTGFGIGTTSVDANGTRKGTRDWYEYFVKPAIGLEYDLGGAGLAYGRLSVIGAGTGGDGDAGFTSSSTAARPEKLLPEDAVIGWKSGEPGVLGLGANALDLSVGNQALLVGDGFMIAEGTGNGGKRGASVVGPRVAFEKTAIARINTQPVRADLFRLSAVVDQTLTQEADNPHSELIGANVEWFGAGEGDTGRFEYEGRKWHVGLMALHFTEADSTGSKNFSFLDGGNGTATGANRDGLNVYSVRVGGSLLPFLPDFALYGEYGIQRNNKAGRDVRANAWYVEPQYTFSDLPWSPRIGYRYALFSGDANTADQTDKSWDPLFPGNGPRGIGTWTQGEIYGRYTGLGNSNLVAQMLSLRATPVADTLDLGLLVFRFDYDEPRQTAGVTETGIMDEVNLYAEWQTPVKGLSLVPLVGAGRPRDGFRQSAGSADANDRTIWLGQLIAAYKF